MEFFGFVAVLCVPLALLFGGATAIESYQCHTYERVTGRPTKYEGFECYVQDGKWYAWTEYKNRFAPKGAQE